MTLEIRSRINALNTKRRSLFSRLEKVKTRIDSLRDKRGSMRVRDEIRRNRRTERSLEREIRNIDQEMGRLLTPLRVSVSELERLKQRTDQAFDNISTEKYLNKVESALNKLVKKKITEITPYVAYLLREILEIEIDNGSVEHVIAKVKEFRQNFKYDKEEAKKLIDHRESIILELFKLGKARFSKQFYELAEVPEVQKKLFDSSTTTVTALKQTTNQRILSLRALIARNNQHVDMGTVSFEGINGELMRMLSEDRYSYDVDRLVDAFYFAIKTEDMSRDEAMIKTDPIAKYAILTMLRVYLLYRYVVEGVEVSAITTLLKSNDLDSNDFKESVSSTIFNEVTYMVVRIDSVAQLERRRDALLKRKEDLIKRGEEVSDDLREEINITTASINRLKQRVFKEIIRLHDVKLTNNRHMWYTFDPFGLTAELMQMIIANRERAFYNTDDHGVDIDNWRIVIPSIKKAGNSNSTADTLSLDDYSLQNVYSEDDNCLIAAILCPSGYTYEQSKVFYKDTIVKHVKTIREKLGILSGRIPIRQAKMIAEYGREKGIINHIIAVVAMTSGKSYYVLKEEGFRKNKNGCRGLMFHDDHVSPIISWDGKTIAAKSTIKIDAMVDGYHKGASPSKAVSSNTNKPKYFLVFDFETYFDPIAFIIPYSFCAMLYNEDGEALETFFATNVYGVMPQFFEVLHNMNQRYGGRNGVLTILGFNNSGFDNFLIMKNIGLIQQDNPLKSLLIANNRILTMNIFGAKIIDLLRFLPPTTLKDVAKAFKTDTAKGSFDHNRIQTLAETSMNAIIEGRNDADVNVFHNWIEENKPELKEYNIDDVKATAEVFFKLRKAVHEVTGIHLESTITISSLCYTYWQKTTGYSDIDLLSMNLCDGVDISDKVIRKAIIAGRTEVNVGDGPDTKFEIHGRFRMKDAKSLYPYAMKDNLYPVGKPKLIEITSLPEDTKLDFGVYQVTIQQKKGVTNIIPDLRHRYEDYEYHDGEDRAKEDSYDWKSKVEMRSIWLNHIDIEQIIKYHGEDAVRFEGPAYVWTETAKVFQSYVENLYKLKQEQDVFKESNDPSYNPALREASKLMLNSLSGKMLQRNFNRDTKLINRGDEQKLQDFLNTHTNCEIQQIGSQQLVSGDDELKLNKFPQIIGIYIYAYARKHMYDSIFSKYRALYTDTDSALLTKDDFNDFVTNYPEQQTDERQLLGSFSDDCPWVDYAIILATKSYFLRFEEGGYKACLKGIRKGSYWTTENLDKLSQEEIRTIIHDPNNGLRCYNAGNRDDDELLFKTLLSGTPVYFPSFQMVKTIKSKTIEGQEIQELAFDIKSYYGSKCLQF